MENLDNLVFDQIRHLATDPADFIQSQQTEDAKPVIEAEISKIDDQMRRLLDLYALGQIPVKMLQEKVTALNEKKERLETDLTELQKPSPQETLQMVQSFADILDQGNFDEIRETLGALIERIVIDGDDIQIYWRFS